MKSPRLDPIRLLLLNTFALTLLFQILLVWRNPVPAFLFKVFFWAEMALLAGAFAAAARRRKSLWIVLLLLLLVRLPFYFLNDGLMPNSDNALEALQSVEILETGRAPFYLLGALSHFGTLRPAMVAQVWDLTGVGYVWIPIFQTILYAVFLLLLDSLLAPVLAWKARLAVLLSQLAFLEVFFDYSLAFRGGPYLEVLIFVLLGFALLSGDRSTPIRAFAAAYFVLFAVYLHPSAALYGVWWAIGALWIFARRNPFPWPALAATAGGVLAGSLAFVAYRILPHPAVEEGSFSQVVLFKILGASLGEIVANFGRAAQHLLTAFRNLHGMEFEYASGFFPGARGESVLRTIKEGIVFLSVIMVVAASVLLVRSYRKKSAGFLWLAPALVLTAMGRTFLMTPKPYLEPRHNLDLGLAVVLSYAVVLGALLKPGRGLGIKFAAVLAGLWIAALPHGVSFFKMSSFRAESYAHLMGVLRKYRVEALSTDFNLAYPVHFLSSRRILVSDSTGPFRIRLFYPRMRARVDDLLPGRKAYLFYDPGYVRSPWHAEATEVVQGLLVRKLDDLKISYDRVQTRDFLILVPRPPSE
jgi:hypothetical protein